MSANRQEIGGRRKIKGKNWRPGLGKPDKPFTSGHEGLHFPEGVAGTDGMVVQQILMGESKQDG